MGRDAPEWAGRADPRSNLRERSAAIARAYEAGGGGPCGHPRADKEYELGSDTGDVGCLRCGMTWWHTKEPPPWEPSFEPKGSRA